MKTVKVLQDESGLALIIALLMIVIVSLIGLASSSTSIFEIILSGNKRGATDAFYTADGGAQSVLANIGNFNTSAGYEAVTTSDLPVELPRLNPLIKNLHPQLSLYLPVYPLTIRPKSPFIIQRKTAFYSENSSRITADKLKTNIWVYIEGIRNPDTKQITIEKIYHLPRYVERGEQDLRYEGKKERETILINIGQYKMCSLKGRPYGRN